MPLGKVLDWTRTLYLHYMLLSRQYWVGLLLFPLYRWANWGSEKCANLINVIYYIGSNRANTQTLDDWLQSQGSCLLYYTTSQAPKSKITILKGRSHTFLPAQSAGRAGWVSFWNNSHSLGSILQDSWLQALPHLHLVGTMSHFIIKHYPHLPILASCIQKSRARITTCRLAFINNILQFPRLGAWINYPSASRLWWSKRWPGWPSLRVGIKKEALITSRRQAEGGALRPRLLLCGCTTIRYLKMHELWF